MRHGPDRDPPRAARLTRAASLLVATALSVWPVAAACAQPACACPPRAAEDIFASDDVVFEGIVVEVQTRAAASVAFVAVDAVYQGRAVAVQRVRTPEGRCDLNMRPGEWWVVVGTPRGRAITSNLCTGSSRSRDLVAERAPIGAEPPVEQTSSPTPIAEPDADRWTIVLAVGLVALAAGATMMLARRQRVGR